MKSSFSDIFVGSFPQLVAVLIGTISAVSDGMQYGWTAPTIPILRSSESPVEITHYDEVWIEACYMIGGFIGLPFTVFLLNVIGRKMTMLLSSAFGVCGWILIATGNHVYYYFIGRILLGMTADIAFTASPVYIAEIAHQKIRGFLAGLIYLMMLIGIIVVYAIGPWIPIYATATVGISLLSVQLILFPFMPESPYFLVYVNKLTEAENALKRLRTETDVSVEMEEIKSAVERQKSEKGRPQDLFLISSNLKASLIMVLLNFTQHFAGSSVLIMNLHSILNEADSKLFSADVSAVMFPCLMLITASVATFIMDDCGRKLLLLISGLFTTISLLMLGIFFHLKCLHFSTNQFSWVPLLSVIIYGGSVKFGLGIVPIVITAELFPANLKGIGMAFADSVYIGSSVLSIHCYQWWTRQFGVHISFYLFSLFCATCSFLIYYFVPETKGKTLEEIQMILKNKDTASKSDTTQVSKV